jgi:transcriptional regulator with XRE-family HTH domain
MDTHPIPCILNDMGVKIRIGIHHRVFGRKVRHFRVHKFLTQEEIAFEIDVEPSYISQIEHGKVNITLDKIYKLAKALGVKPEELFR